MPHDKPIPREETPTPDPVMQALEKILATQTEHGKVLSSVVASQTDLVTRVDRLEKDANNPNQPPRTPSGFTAAVTKVATEIAEQTTRNSEADIKTRFEKLESDVSDIHKEMGVQTKLLNTLVEGLGSFAKNPTVRKLAYVGGGLFLGWLTHLAAKHGLELPLP